MQFALTKYIFNSLFAPVNSARVAAQHVSFVLGVLRSIPSCLQTLSQHSVCGSPFGGDKRDSLAERCIENRTTTKSSKPNIAIPEHGCSNVLEEVYVHKIFEMLNSFASQPRSNQPKAKEGARSLYMCVTLFAWRVCVSCHFSGCFWVMCVCVWFKREGIVEAAEGEM